MCTVNHHTCGLDGAGSRRQPALQRQHFSCWEEETWWDIGQSLTGFSRWAPPPSPPNPPDRQRQKLAPLSSTVLAWLFLFLLSIFFITPISLLSVFCTRPISLLSHSLFCVRDGLRKAGMLDHRSVCPCTQNHRMMFFVGCLAYQQHARVLLNISATCQSISETDLLPQLGRSCRSNFLSHPVTVYLYWTSQSHRWPFSARLLAGKPLKYQCLCHWH